MRMANKSWWKIVWRKMGLKCHNTCESIRNFVKLCQHHRKVPVFSGFAFKNTNFAQMLKIFAQACVCTSATEALVKNIVGAAGTLKGKEKFCQNIQK